MTIPGQHTYQEILSQPESWAEALEAARAAAPAVRRLWLGAGPWSQILFTGCGSTYYLSLSAAALARSRGVAAQAHPASELWLHAGSMVPAPESALLVCVSRSGETSETVRAAETYRARGGRAVIAVTCDPASSLASRADLVIAIPGAQEQSMAQTRSFASMLIAAQALIAATTGDTVPAGGLLALPALGGALIARYEALAARLGADLGLEQFFFLGNGVFYGLAQEGMLKMKEMSLSHSEAYHVLEFRHGPKAMVDAATLVVGLLGDEARAEEAAVLAEVKGLGARVLVLSDDGDAARSGGDWASGGAHASAGAEYEVVLGSGLPVAERAVLYLPVLQLLAYHRAIAKGLDPDRPRNLTAAIVL